MPRAKMPRVKKMEARREMVASLRERGYSFSEIGKMLKPPVTGQAVGRMVARMKR